MTFPKIGERRLYFRKPFPMVATRMHLKKLSYIATSMNEIGGDFGLESFEVKVLARWISVQNHLRYLRYRQIILPSGWEIGDAFVSMG